MYVKKDNVLIKTFMDSKISINVKYSRISNDKDRHVNHCDFTGTHYTKEPPVSLFC